VVYDLGCGDGRIVVAAAKKHGAKAVGVDIDPRLLEQARAKVEAAKVAHLVTIREEDLFKTDITSATVVTLYLNDNANLALMPILKKSLKPGSRIVSQTWDMGDWKPDRTITAIGVDEKERTKHEYKLYLWIIGDPKDKGEGKEIIGTIERLDARFDKLVPKDARLEKIAEGFIWAGKCLLLRCKDHALDGVSATYVLELGNSF
jgi:SAM-dependent methyltransferase